MKNPGAESQLQSACGAICEIGPGRVLGPFVVFGERHLRYLLKEFLAHYHTERFHQGLGGQLIEKQAGSTSEEGACGKVVFRSRLGGMLKNENHTARDITGEAEMGEAKTGTLAGTSTEKTGTSEESVAGRRRKPRDSGNLACGRCRD